MVPTALALLLTVLSMLVMLASVWCWQFLPRDPWQIVASWFWVGSVVAVLFFTWQWKTTPGSGFGPFVPAVLVEFGILVVWALIVMSLATARTNQVNAGRRRK